MKGTPLFLTAFLAVSLSGAAIAKTAAGQPDQVQQPKGNWQTPGPIQRPKGPWQKPGKIQVPKGIQAISSHTQTCEHRYTVAADALFAFDQATLSPDAEKTLGVLGPMLQKTGHHPVKVFGFTDAIGSDAYNQDLSERRARTVRDWLVAHHDVLPGTAIEGFGKQHPVASNTNPDGSDNPAGRQKNRRVEVVVDTCR